MCVFVYIYSNYLWFENIPNFLVVFNIIEIIHFSTIQIVLNVQIVQIVTMNTIQNKNYYTDKEKKLLHATRRLFNGFKIKLFATDRDIQIP